MNSVENALRSVKKTHYGDYHDIGLVLEKLTVQELFDYCIEEFREMYLRDYLEEQIIENEIMKSRKRINCGGN